jgi:hypothetical protein
MTIYTHHATKRNVTWTKGVNIVPTMKETNRKQMTKENRARKRGSTEETRNARKKSTLKTWGTWGIRDHPSETSDKETRDV